MRKTFEAKDISVNAGEIQVVFDASLSCSAGEIILVIGPNGSGKSSLLNAIFGHPRFTMTGAIYLDEEDITKENVTDKAKRGLFLSPQHPPEVPGVSLLQFLHRAYKSIHGTEVLSVLDFRKKIETIGEELGINTSFLSKEINHKLSGGEKKQSEILQLAALKPRFAFLDEIDSGVDVEATTVVFNAIKHLKNTGAGFVVVSHNPNFSDYLVPDRVYVMKGGRVVRSGRAEILEDIKKNGF